MIKSKDELRAYRRKRRQRNPNMEDVRLGIHATFLRLMVNSVRKTNPEQEGDMS